MHDRQSHGEVSDIVAALDRSIHALRQSPFPENDELLVELENTLTDIKAALSQARVLG